MIALRLPGVDAVGFDLDGTLLDHPAAAVAGVTALLHAHGIATTPAHADLWFAVEARHFGRWLTGESTWQQQRRDRVRDVFAANGLPSPDDEQADAAFEVFRAAYEQNWRAYPDVIETIERIRAAGVRIGVLTNGPGHQQREKLAAIGLSDLVDVMCAADEIGCPKPDADAFRQLTAQLDVDASRVIFIGDDEVADVRGAQAVGIRAALVRARHRGVAELPSALRRAAASMIAAADQAPGAIVR